MNKQKIPESLNPLICEVVGVVVMMLVNDEINKENSKGEKV